MDWIDAAYINRVSIRLERFKERQRGRFNFRCPICGDSAKDKNKARGWLFDKDGEAKFHCFNDETCGSNLSYFLFRVDKSLAGEYRLDKFKEYGQANKRTTSSTTSSVFDDIDDVAPKKSGDPAFLHELPTIESLSADHFARKYIADRLIPIHLWNKIYFTDKWKLLTNQFEQTYDKIYKDEPRIVIPAYNKAGELICFQGRSLDPECDEKKYLTVLVKDELKIWGMNKVNNTKPVFLLEGAFDAMFLDNTAAILGGSANPDLLDPDFDWVFVLDNEPRNQSVCRRYQTLIKRGAKFVSWMNWKYKWKDINLCVQNGVSPQEIQQYFERNTVSGLAAQLQFDKWCKIPL